MPAADELPVLWQYSFSNYNEKARWALDFKGIRHRRRSLMPGGPRAMMFSRGDGTLPVLDLDGTRIVDSTADHRRAGGAPARAGALPGRPGRAPPGARARGLLRRARRPRHAPGRLLGGAPEPGLRARLHDDRSAQGQGRGRPAWRGVAFPGVWRYMSARYAFDEEAVMRSRQTLVERPRPDRVGARRRRLPGRRMRSRVADLTAAALLYPLVWPPRVSVRAAGAAEREFLEPYRDHPALDWIAETWRRHRGSLAATSPPSPARP